MEERRGEGQRVGDPADVRDQVGDGNRMVDVGLGLGALPLLAAMMARGEVRRPEEDRRVGLGSAQVAQLPPPRLMFFS
jgi:hypothetical protein